jgi:hypothetical protein
MPAKKTAKKRAKKAVKKKVERDPKFVFEGSVIFKYTGVTTEHIGKLRDKYVPASDKLFIRGSGYYYTKSGIDIILKKLGLLWSDLETKQEWCEVVKLTGNYKRIFCEEVATGKMIRVKVSNSKNFRTGMIVPIINKIGDTATLARKCPRSLGCW